MPIQVTAKVLNLDKVLNNFDKLEDLDGYDALLLKCGLVVEDAAKENLISMGRVKSGALVNSIKTSDIDNHEVAVYSTSPYATYVEYGTGAYAEAGNGRPGWWVYVDEECGASKSTKRTIYTYEEACRVWHKLASKYGENHVHMTQGQTPTRFLRKALENNEDKIISTLQAYINEKVKDANA